MITTPRHAALAAAVLLCLACGGSGPQASTSTAKNDAPPPSPVASPAAPQLYLQTKLSGDQSTLQILQVNEEAGKLQLTCGSALAMESPNNLSAFNDLAFTANGAEAYASASFLDADGHMQNAVYSFLRNPVTGMLTPIDQDSSSFGLQGQPTMGLLRSFVIDTMTQRLFGAEQASMACQVNGGISSFSVQAGRGLSRVDAHSIASPDSFLDSRDFATEAYTLTQILHPSGRFLYTLSPWACGPMQFRAYAIEGATGALSPLTAAPSWLSTRLSLDLAMDPSGRMLIGMGSVGALELFSIDATTGLPTPLTPIPTALQKNEHGEQILMHPSGDFFFMRRQTNGDGPGGIEIYALKATEGSVHHLGSITTGVNATQAALDPTGRWLAVLNMGTRLNPTGTALPPVPTIELYYFNSTTGQLSHTDSRAIPGVQDLKLIFAPR